MGESTLRPRRVVDASPGGLLVELGEGVTPPPVGSVVSVRLRQGEVSVEQIARIVRVRWIGRHRGTRLPPAIALEFVQERGAPEQALSLAALLASTVAGTSP